MELGGVMAGVYDPELHLMTFEEFAEKCPWRDGADQLYCKTFLEQETVYACAEQYCGLWYLRGTL